MAHEFNNFLNVLLLQVAVFEQTLPEERRAELEPIRRQGKQMAALVRQWQHYRRRQQPAPRPVDLNRTLQDVVAAAGPHASVRLELAADLPPVSAPPAELERLCTFLLNHALALSAPGSPVVARTSARADGVQLRFSDSGPPADAGRLFDLTGPGRADACTLELAACQSMVRRLQGKIHAENRPEGGVTVTVELPITKGSASHSDSGAREHQ